jgi:hypothetical protein
MKNPTIENKLYYPKIKQNAKIYGKTLYKKEIREFKALNINYEEIIKLVNKNDKKIKKEIEAFNKSIGKNFKKDLSYIRKNYKKEEEYEQIRELVEEYIYTYTLTIGSIKLIENYGNQVFFIKKEFWNLLAHTDFPEELKANVIKPPYKAFCLELEDFLVQSPDNTEINLGTIFVIFEENNIYFIILARKTNKLLLISPQEIEISPEENLKSIKEKIDNSFISKVENLETYEELKQYKNSIVETIKKEREIGKIIINLLLYINHINDDTQTIEEYGRKDEIPVKANKRNENLKQNENKKKKENKYTKLHIIGTKTAQYYHSELEKAGKPKKPHWRRGHIRFLKHPKFKKEWTYVRPALIGKGNIDKDKERIYTT